MVRFNGRRLIFVRYIGLDLKGRIFLRFFSRIVRKRIIDSKY